MGFVLLSFFVSAIVACVTVLFVTAVPKALYQMLRSRTLLSFSSLKLQRDGVIPAILGGGWGLFVGFFAGGSTARFLPGDGWAAVVTLPVGATIGFITGVVCGALKLNLSAPYSTYALSNEITEMAGKQ